MMDISVDFNPRFADFCKKNKHLSPGKILCRLVTDLREGRDYNPTLEIDILDRISKQIDSYISQGIKSFAAMELTPSMMNYDEYDEGQNEHKGFILGPANFIWRVFTIMGFKSKILRGNSHEPEKFWLVIYL